MKRQYFYDRQFRRYITQIIRLFSGFQIKYYSSTDNGTVERFRTIPCIWGDMSRQGATWLSQNSDNVASIAPIMAMTITDLQKSDQYRSVPLFQQDTHFSKKQKNPSGKGYLNKPDTMYKVSQHMPVPYRMTFNIDILCTSTEEKLEILEQVLGLFNPGFQMKANASPFDIGKYFEIILDSIQWTSKSVPVGTAVDLDVATLTFTVEPVHINVPSKIRRNSLIKRIVTNVSISDEDILSQTIDDLFTNGKIQSTESIVVTPTDYSFRINKEGDDYFGYVLDENNDPQDWEKVFDAYGTSEENNTWIRARRNEDADDENYDVYMQYEFTDDETKILLNLDENSFKVPGIEPITKIINPNKKTPTQFGNAFGTRYLLTQDIDPDNTTWGITALAHSIIESTENGWIVTFDPEISQEEYVINLAKNDQYYFDGQQWQHYIIGTYSPRYWMFDVQSICK